MQVEVKDPIEVISFPSSVSLYPGETKTFSITLNNKASVNYSLVSDFQLGNSTYQEQYVLFSDELYTVIPGQQTLTASIQVSSDAPAINTSLSLNLTRCLFPSGVVAFWKLDDGKGSIAFDSSGLGNHGVINGSTWVNGIVGKALQFDGSNDLVSIGSSDSLKVSTVSVAGWFKIKGITGDHQIILTCDTLSNTEYTLELKPDGRTPQFAVHNPSGFPIYAISITLLSFDEWVFVVGTFDGSTVKIYVNGVLTGSSPLSSTINIQDETIQLGAHKMPSDRNWLYGAIDSIMVFDRALTANEVTALFNNPIN